jgi:hypothetical protein
MLFRLFFHVGRAFCVFGALVPGVAVFLGRDWGRVALAWVAIPGSILFTAVFFPPLMFGWKTSCPHCGKRGTWFYSRKDKVGFECDDCGVTYARVWRWRLRAERREKEADES